VAPDESESRDLSAAGPRAVAVGGNVSRSTIVTGTLYEVVLARRYWLPVGIAVLILLIGAALVIVQQVRSAASTPSRMLGGINLAIAEFRDVDAQGRFLESQRADDLGRLVQLTLEKHASAAVEGATTETWPPTWTGRVDGAARAAERARDIGADVIVYGTVQVGDDTTIVRPKFYLSPRLLGDAPELAAEYQLGADISSLGDIKRNTATFEDLKQQLVERTETLAQVVHGLGQYQRGDVAAAAAAFRTAEQQRAWEGTQGKEVLYLFSGYAAARSGDVNTARGYFSLAESSPYPPTRARAKLGLSQL
jgi:hypothetical protein